MTFARLVLLIRQRVAALAEVNRRPDVIARIAREVLDSVPEGEQSAQVRRILAAFLGLGEHDEFDAATVG